MPEGSSDFGLFFTEKPLDALQPFFLFVHNPFLMGLAYFAPRDLCFSMFFGGNTVFSLK